MKTLDFAASLVTVALLAPAERTWTNAIDGNWCFADGRRMSIQGSDLVTPGGKRIIGDSDRNAFAYVAPGGEGSAGLKMFMVVIDEDTMQLVIGTAPSASGEGEVWRRCSERMSWATSRPNQTFVAVRSSPPVVSIVCTVAV